MLYPKMENRKSAFIYPPFSVSNLRTFHLAYPCFKCLILNPFQIGPLRCWPGGLCLSRSIGDMDVGEFIVPIPYVKQVKV